MLVDTDVLSLFLRGHERVVDHFRSYLTQHDRICFSIISYYEIVSGLRHKDAYSQLDRFKTFVRYNRMLPLTTASCDISAEIYARLRRAGKTLEDIDLLIVGIALDNDLGVATRNTDHFERIQELTVEN
jgi:tRNA(fMet)-specific endonuclease VapC